MIPRFTPALGERLAFIERQSSRRLAELTVHRGKSEWPIHFPSVAYNWTTFVPLQAPAFDKSGKQVPQPKWSVFYANSEEEQALISLLLSGRIGFVYWTAMGDDFDVTKGQMLRFPLPRKPLAQEDADQLLSLFREFSSSLESVTNYKLNAGKRIGRFDILRLRSITEKSDRILASWLGLSEEMLEKVDLQIH